MRSALSSRETDALVVGLIILDCLKVSLANDGVITVDSKASTLRFRLKIVSPVSNGERFEFNDESNVLSVGNFTEERNDDDDGDFVEVLNRFDEVNSLGVFNRVDGDDDLEGLLTKTDDDDDDDDDLRTLLTRLGDDDGIGEVFNRMDGVDDSLDTVFNSGDDDGDNGKRLDCLPVLVSDRNKLDAVADDEDKRLEP